ncbi:MAG: hypothetical protein AAGH45_01010 [Pseudomonadota bacterium]
MSNFVSVAEAREASGMRLIVAEGVPGPWAEGIRGVLDYKSIPYIRGRFEMAGPHDDLIAWSAQASVPVIAWEDEFPRSAWVDQIFLAERVQATPSVIPDTIEDRMRMFGLLAEICTPGGFGWCRRLMLVHNGLTAPGWPAETRPFFENFGAKYGYTPAAAEAAGPRVVEILKALDGCLAAQEARGSRYFIGDAPTALDIYWAGFSHLIEPLPASLCPMIEDFRPMYVNTDNAVAAAATQRLMDHREFIYREHLGLPMAL